MCVSSEMGEVVRNGIVDFGRLLHTCAVWDRLISGVCSFAVAHRGPLAPRSKTHTRSLCGLNDKRYFYLPRGYERAIWI